MTNSLEDITITLNHRDLITILVTLKDAKYAAYMDINPASDYTHSRLCSIVEKLEDCLKRNRE